MCFSHKLNCQRRAGVLQYLSVCEVDAKVATTLQVVEGLFVQSVLINCPL